MVLNRVQADFATELAAVEQELARNLECPALPLMHEVGLWILRSGGKRLRPLMTLLSARCFTPEVSDLMIRTAAAMELVHTATLLHDDVVDRSNRRRGRETVNARWGDDVAVLAADRLYSNVFALAVDELDKPLLSLVAKTTARMCESELLQIERRGHMLSPDEYNSVAESKTAGLFACCCAMGAHLAHADDRQCDTMKQFGHRFGMLFQATDDILDFRPDTQTGKPQFADLINRKQSLPVVAAYENATPDERAAFIVLWRDPNTPPQDLDTFVQHNGGIQAAEKHADRLAEETLNILNTLNPAVVNPRATDRLGEIVRFTGNRIRES